MAEEFPKTCHAMQGALSISKILSLNISSRTGIDTQPFACWLQWTLQPNVNNHINFFPVCSHGADPFLHHDLQMQLSAAAMILYHGKLDTVAAIMEHMVNL